MFKRMQKRMAALCTCATLIAAMPLSVDGCLGDMTGGVLGGAGSMTEVVTNQSASASAGNGVATATASSTSTVTPQQGVFGGGWIGGTSGYTDPYGGYYDDSYGY